MAEFCTKCVVEHNVCEKEKADIKVKEIFDKLTPGNMMGPFICEGCGLHYIIKDAEGNLLIKYYDKKEPIKKDIKDYE